MAKITSVAALTAKIPLDKVTSFARRTVHERFYALVRIKTDDGQHGIGFCYAGNAGGELVSTAVRELFAPMLIGEDPHRTEGLWAEMYQQALLQGRAGAVMRAISAIDTALWDRNARAAGLPLASYLGAAAKRTVPAYASGGYYLEGKTPAMLGEECRLHVEQGFKAVKIKVGRLSFAEEEARIKAAREAIGSDILLMLDANNAWADVPTALTYCRRYEPYDPYWIEEPFGPDEIDSHARLAALTSITVATGEIEVGRWRFKELLDKQACEILQTDAAVCGGVTEFRRIAAIASGYGVTLCPHWFHDLHVHLVAATPNATFVEFFPDDQVLNFRRLVDRQLVLEDGTLVVPDRPGLGFDFDPAALKKYGLGEWR